MLGRQIKKSVLQDTPERRASLTTPNGRCAGWLALLRASSCDRCCDWPRRGLRSGVPGLPCRELRAAVAAGTGRTAACAPECLASSASSRQQAAAGGWRGGSHCGVGPLRWRPKEGVHRWMRRTAIAEPPHSGLKIIIPVQSQPRSDCSSIRTHDNWLIIPLLLAMVFPRCRN